MNTKAKVIQALKTWIIIYPSVTVFYIFFGEFISSIPIYKRTFILTLVLVPWMVFIGFPLLHFILKKTNKIEKP